MKGLCQLRVFLEQMEVDLCRGDDGCSMQVQEGLYRGLYPFRSLRFNAEEKIVAVD